MTLTGSSASSSIAGFISGRTDQDEPSVLLGWIGEYLSYVAGSMNHRRLRLEAPVAILEQFESVCLKLQEVIASYPAAVVAQVQDLLVKNELRTTIATLANLDRYDLADIRIKRMLGPFAKVFGVKLPDSFGQITNSSIFSAKVALGRLAQIVKYSSSLEPTDYDTIEPAVREHYNPELIDKHRVLAWLNILRAECEAIPAGSAKDVICSRIASIELELKRSSPRWGKLVATTFIVLSVLADLRSVAPETYSRAFQVAEHILKTIQIEGLVEAAKHPISLPDEFPTPAPVLLAPARKEEEE